MSSKNALLFFLAVFGIVFIAVDACLPVWGLNQLHGAMASIGALMLIAFLALVLGLGFILKLFYLIFASGSAAVAVEGIFINGDFVEGIVGAVIAFVLLAFIPTVFLKK